MTDDTGDAGPSQPNRLADETQLLEMRADLMFEKTLDYIKENPRVRKDLSERAKRGCKEKGHGAIVLDLFARRSASASGGADGAMVRDPAEAVSGEQAVWLSNAELSSKFRGAWTRSEPSELYRDRNVRDYPHLADVSAMFATRESAWPSGERQELMKEYERNPESPQLLPQIREELASELSFFTQWGGIWQHDFLRAAKAHFERRRGGEKLPFRPSDEVEHHVMTAIRADQRGSYDKLAKDLFELSPIESNTPLWTDHAEKGEYFFAFNFPVCCFIAASAGHEERAESAGEGIHVDGWHLLGVESLAFWLIGHGDAPTKEPETFIRTASNLRKE